MGNLKKYMPITYITSLIGAIALTGLPPFSGFFSKDMIIEAVKLSSIPGATFAYYAVLSGVLITSLYTFRLIFLVFHTKERMDQHTREHLHESPMVVWIPLVLLAIPSMVIGWFTIEPLLFAEPNYFHHAIWVMPQHDVLTQLSHHFTGSGAMVLHAFQTLPCWLAIAGLVIAWVCYVKYPRIPGFFMKKFSGIYRILDNKYGFDAFNQTVFAGGSRALGRWLWRVGDVKIIDGIAVNGSAYAVGAWSRVMRGIQSGYLYHYAFAMILGLLAFTSWLLWF